MSAIDKHVVDIVLTGIPVVQKAESHVLQLRRNGHDQWLRDLSSLTVCWVALPISSRNIMNRRLAEKREY